MDRVELPPEGDMLSLGLFVAPFVKAQFEGRKLTQKELDEWTEFYKDWTEEMRNCQLQDICKKYKRGNKPPNNHVRLTEPCDKFIECSCEMYMRWMDFQGTPIKCKVKQ